ncbi:aspartate/glutamate racemase family protein [Kutzneria buriramensis]|uniref:Allantoin racemase n=1 Tax=Kutzneria buriramensis TaxID=1045776 RepID=A0A3E0HI67_9PSEU|nr:aspartate/glutamate racemase family protein [Kutzneria buriramensis]REH46184.1 allantoin racemase [Kutzneria buriramensis]
MLIKVVNPNTTAAMTAVIERAARDVAGPGTTVRAVTSRMGPASIESHYDEALSVPGVLAEISGADGYVIACFGDPGLDAARELAEGPVVGIAEAAMHAAAFLGRGFTVVTTLGRTVGRAWDLADRYGMARHCRRVRACEVPVLEVAVAEKAIAKECRSAAVQDGCDAIVLGCAGMADLAARLTAEIGLPVIDGVAAATLQVQSLITMGLRTGSRQEYAPPLPKPYTGPLAPFEIPA